MMQNPPSHRYTSTSRHGHSVDEHLRALLSGSRSSLPSLDTAYLKYTKTNYVASGQGASAIAEIVHQRQAQLNAADIDIATVGLILDRAREVYQRLLENRSKIIASMKAHLGLISAGRRLPPEILSEIFLWSLPPDTDMPTKPNPRVAPLLFTAVCRMWQRVAYDTPRLWRSLLIQLSDAATIHDLYFYYKWLSLARLHPLTLTVDTRLVQLQCQILKPLLPFVDRVVRLHVAFMEGAAPVMLLKKVPALEYLWLEGPLHWISDFKLIQAEPRLHTLELSRTMFSPDPTLLPNLGWEHLTQLHITLDRAPQAGLGDMDGQIIFVLLALCPKLENFAFCPLVILNLNAAVSLTRPLKHENLRSLTLCVKSGHSFLLSMLTLPKLRYLRVEAATRSPEAWKFEDFKALVLRSSCPVDTLILHGVQGWFHRESLMDYIMLLPTLMQLDLRPLAKT